MFVPSKALVLIGLRSTALALQLQGQQGPGAALILLADGIESGQNVDDHMELIAQKLKAGNASAEDWEDVADRIMADSARLQAS